MRKLIAPLLALMLMACAETNVIRSTQNQVVMPPTEYFRCETVSSFPTIETLTDIQVANLLVNLYQNNRECRLNIQAIRAYLEEAKRTIETQQ